MYRSAISLALLGLLGIWSLTAGPNSSPPDQKQEQKKEAQKSTASMTGCVDEQEGHYILIDDRTRAPIANLEADGFPVEGFAKHLGHKVTVRGTVIPAGERPQFRVRVIETISDACEPQLHQ
ncbi:MAG TPA: hypothetical protein VE959_13570 [Bryobacteraceae bacterium]|nr:hypothetical protein [Bryobacteraceae bacterium]